MKTRASDGFGPRLAQMRARHSRADPPGMRSAATGGVYRPTLPLLHERMHQVIAADGKNPVAPSRSRRFDWQDTVRSCSWTT